MEAYEHQGPPQPLHQQDGDQVSQQTVHPKGDFP